MTPEEHYREAERLAKLGADMWVSPEGDYDDATPPSTEELATRAVVQDQALRQAAVVLAEAQVHAVLSLSRPLLELGVTPEFEQWMRAHLGGSE